MAKVRYYTEFRSSRGDFYLLEIWDTSHTGDEKRVYCDGNGFVLTHDGETDAVFSPIIGSSITFNLYNQDSAFDTFLTDVLTQQDKRFFVKLYRSKYESGDDLNGWYNTTKVVEDGIVMFATPYEERTKYYNIFWAGYIVQDLIEQADESKPRLTSFKAADGISLLSTIDYEFSLSATTKNIKDILVDILNDSGVSSLFEGDDILLTTTTNWWANEHVYNATNDPMVLTRFDLKAFTQYTQQDGRTYTNALEVIREICLTFGARFYFDTSFRFEQISERDNINIREFRYLPDGTQYDNESLSLDVDVDQSNIYRSSGLFRYLPAVKRVSLTLQKKSSANIIGGSIRYDSSFGDEIDLGVIPSADNGRILLDMRSEIQTFISTPTSGVATPIFAVTIRLEPSDGTANQYWTNQLISGQTSFGVGSWGTTSGTYKFAATNVSRQTSATTASVRNVATGPLPKDGEVFLDITILGLYDAQGSSTSFFIGGNSYAWAVDLRSARYENDNNPSSIVDSTFSAINTSTSIGSNITIDLGTTRLGDGAGAIGSLYVYDGSSWTPSTGWREGNSGSFVDIARMVTKNILSLQVAVVKRFEGTTIQGHNFKNRLTFDGFKWLQLRGDYNANRDEYNGEWFAIAKNTALTDITENPVDSSDFTAGDIIDHSGEYINASNGMLGGMVLNGGTNSLGPFSETANGGAVEGDLDVTSNISATDVDATGDVNATGALTGATAQISGQLDAGDANVADLSARDVDATGAVSIVGTTNLADDVTMESDLEVQGDATTQGVTTQNGALVHDITDITHSDGSNYNVTASDYIMFNTWSGGDNGEAIVILPLATNNEGRLLRLKSDSTISANKRVVLVPSGSDTIDGDSSYTMNRSYDGITILAHNDRWFIIQRKEK
jgi:hypothetical protein